MQFLTIYCPGHLGLVFNTFPSLGMMPDKIKRHDLIQKPTKLGEPNLPALLLIETLFLIQTNLAKFNSADLKMFFFFFIQLAHYLNPHL